MRVGVRLGLALLRVHQAVYDRSGGRIGHRLLGVDCLLLRTAGRRSGRRRTAALAYARDGRDYLVVASVGGSDRPPGWLANARAEPSVEVQVGRRRFGATASVVEPGDAGYEPRWRLVNERSSGRYRRYQSRTQRGLPVVVLRPTA
ncbi:MAG TPA: nitroreductase/quinone reductase family protein [Acidimicrobiales bacterium]|nr:nitroreductase/quinone reductase family protein [Acidimicrobiales bacterium]